MGEYNLCNDYIELIAGTNNVYAASYLEAANNIKKNNKVAMGYLKNFITSIENIANKSETKDKRISDSKGNIKQFDGYENIQFAIEFIQKNLSGLFGFRELVTIHDKLIEYQTEYQDGYNKRCRMVMLEYDNALYLLVTGLSMLISNNMEVIQNGSVIKIQKTNEGTHGVIAKAIKDMATQLSDKNHKIYLDTLNKEIDNIPVSTDITESTSFMESDVLDFLQLIDRIGSRIGNTVKAGVNIGKTIIKSAFGIIPLIRSIMYLRYKKKADTINALDEQCAFIKLNIDQLNNRTNMDPKKKEIIIKKQAAVIERYQKKAAKLRAELMEQEKDATTALEKENPELKKTNDDFVLEGVSISEMFQEYDELPSFNELFEEATDELFEEESHRKLKFDYRQVEKDNIDTVRTNNLLKKIAIANGYNGEMNNDDIKRYLKTLTKITIPNSVTSICKGAFCDYESLKSIIIPNSVTSIGIGAFAECTSLENITLSNNLKKIGVGVFEDCKSLKSISIPNSVTKIDDYAFNGCDSLKSITIPSSVTSIAICTFSMCTSLKSITIPNSVTEISEWAFGCCESLKSITIPNSVTKIGKATFYECTNLKDVKILGKPKIDPNAFNGCKNLSDESKKKILELQPKAVFKTIFYD